MFTVAKVLSFLSAYWVKAVIVVAIVGAIWGHGYYTAYQYWDDWYDLKVIEQNAINKQAEERGLKEAERIKQEEQNDEEKLKQNELEAQTDPNRNSPALSHDSVQRLKRL